MLTEFVRRMMRPNIPRLGSGVLRGHSRTHWYFWLTLVFYVSICAMVYFAYVEPWIAGDIDIRIGADSDRYWDTVKQLRSGGHMPFLSTTGNALGPVSVGLLLHNGVGVMVFNLLLLLLSLKIASSIPDLDLGIFGLLLLFNLELIPNLTTLNKEIFALLSSVLIAKYLYAKKPSFLLLSGTLLVAAFARWEQAGILLLYLTFRSLFRNHPKTALIVLIALLTVGFPFGLKILGLDLTTFDWLMKDANTILVLNKIEFAYGFPLVIIPKTVMVMAGVWVSPSFYTANPGIVHGFSDPQQELFQPLGCIALMATFTYAVWTKRMRLSSPVAMFIAITLVVTAATPFIQPRYLYGSYVMLCIELARPKCLYGVGESSSKRIRKLLIGSGRMSQIPSEFEK